MSVQDLRSAAARADRIVQGTVLGRLQLQDGTTTGTGLDVRVDENLLGTASSPRLAVWQPLDVPDLDKGVHIFFVSAHPATTSDGAPLNGYDTVAAGSVLAVEDDKRIRRVCRAGRGPATDRRQLDAVVG